MRAIRVRSCVGHGQASKSSVLTSLAPEVLVSELLSVNRLAACPVPTSEVATLAHEIFDDTVKGGTLEIQRFAALAHALLASAEAAKVFDGLGHNIMIKLELDSPRGRTADGYVEENNGVGHALTFEKQLLHSPRREVHDKAAGAVPALQWLRGAHKLPQQCLRLMHSMGAARQQCAAATKVHGGHSGTAAVHLSEPTHGFSVLCQTGG